jgi:ABC-type branched-subunit amino acid transport system substrate-binding protein
VVKPAPYLVGVLDDTGSSAGRGLERWLRLATEDLLASGRLDREVELVHAEGLGLPQGTAANVQRAFGELVDHDVLLIVGPAIGDNALVATPLAEAAEVPTINWAGTERARGEWMFHLQVGSHEDESLVLARHLCDLGATRVGVIFDRSPIGRRHLSFFVDEAELLGLTIGATASIPPLAADAQAQLEAVAATDCDAVCYLGLGLSAPAVGRGLHAAGFEGPRAMNTAGLRGWDPAFAAEVDGFWYLDMASEHNEELRRLSERQQLSFREAAGASRGWDLGRLAAEGLARAPERTREGVRSGLELIKWLPAAEGYEGTQLGFGHRDRGALHGRYLVVRRWVGGESVEAR